MIERFPTAEERWPRQGLTMPYNFPKLVIEEHEGFHICLLYTSPSPRD